MSKFRLGLLVLFIGVVSVTDAFAASPLALVCTVHGDVAENAPAFEEFVCDQALEQARAAGFRPRQIGLVQLGRMQNAKASGRWIHFDITVVSKYAVNGVATWGGGSPPVTGTGSKIEAGISDAGLNIDTATLLVRTMLANSPFVPLQAPK